MMASVLIVSVLIFKGYGNGLTNQNAGHVEKQQQVTPLKKAEDVNQLVLDAATTRRQELEKQTQ
jgi:hypothetical protein